MAIESVIGGLGFTSFLFLYACFNISTERYIEKMLLYFFGIVTALLIPFSLLAESLEVGSSVAYLSDFFTSYFVICIILLIAIIFFFAFHIITKQLNPVAGEKEDE